MEEQIILIYCVCADLLNHLDHVEDKRRRMTDAEMMTTAIVAALHFGGNHEKSRLFLKSHQYVPQMLGTSRFNRRLHQLDETCLILFHELAHLWHRLNKEAIYSIDSFPICVCDNYRICRSKIYKGEAYRGKITSKNRYFYGVRVHLMITEKGHPVEFCISPGRDNDLTYLKAFSFDLEPGSTVYADRGYNDYTVEDLLADQGIRFLPMRKKNSKRPLPPWTAYLQHLHRKRIETTASLVERLLPKSIHAVTAKGFELKVALFVIACSIQGLSN